MGRAAHCRSLGGADGAPRLRQVRRAGRRLGRDGFRDRRRDRREARDRIAQQHAVGVPGGREWNRALRRGNGRSRCERRVLADRRRVPGDSGQESADPRLRTHRLAGRSRGLDRREVPRLDRQQRQPRRRAHARSDPHEHQRVLVHQDDQFVDPSLLRVATDRPLRSDERVRAGADRGGGVPPRDLPGPEGLRGDALQPRALHALRPRRSLRRARGTRPVRRRHQSLLQGAALISTIS